MVTMDTTDSRPPREARLRAGPGPVVIAGVLAVTLPLIGFVSLLLREQLDPQLHNHQAHFLIFGFAGGVAFALGYAAGEAANRRGDARVLLLSLAFMATGGFMGLHAFGTAGVLFSESHAGFQIAIPVGLLVSAFFAVGSAFVDSRPELARRVIRQRGRLRAGVLAAMAVWFLWTLANLPPLRGPNSEAATGKVLGTLAVLGTIAYAVSAVRYWRLFRHRPTLLSMAVIACFLLLAEAMIGVAITGERKWHASWWEWHGLILFAYLIIGFAARREWREERFRQLYLPSTRERRQEISVLFGDLQGYTSFAERTSPAEAAAVLEAYWGAAAPLLARRFGGEVEKFIGDGIVATFNRRGDQPDHALRAARAALALQRAVSALADEHPGWPRLRVGVNSGEAVLREIGGAGHVAYPLVGDTVNTGARLESLAPAGGVLIGAGTHAALPAGAAVEPMSGLRMKGKDEPVDAYLLLGLA
ncbi:MAG TPA: adenylate/guanylate cyclase domain-containing protein [Gaiellaceae bacterium]|nr:adenylate/guanylate cyclase domain-containing protein [Gaiellaceae bacterium]